METTILYWGYMGYIGIMEHKMETTILYWGYMGYIGILENKMEPTILYWDVHRRLESQKLPRLQCPKSGGNLRKSQPNNGPGVLPLLSISVPQACPKKTSRHEHWVRVLGLKGLGFECSGLR